MSTGSTGPTMEPRRSKSAQKDNATSSSRLSLQPTEMNTIVFQWPLSNLKQIFESSRQDTKSKVIKSAPFGGGRWTVLFYAQSGHDQYCSLYLNAEPLKTEKVHPLTAATQRATPSAQGSAGSGANATATAGTSEQSGAGGTAGGSASAPSPQAKDVGWTRKGTFRFVFTIQTLERSQNLGSKEAFDHAFSHKTSNWGWAQFAKRDSVYFSNTAVKTADAFVINVTIQERAEKPRTEKPTGVTIPTSLIKTMGALLDDPYHSDVVFLLKTSRTSGDRSRSRSTQVVPRFRRIYAMTRMLSARSEYFRDMFESGFVEAELSNGWSSMRDRGDAPPTHDPTVSNAVTSNPLSRNSSTSSASSGGTTGDVKRDGSDFLESSSRFEDDGAYDHEVILEDSDAELDDFDLNDRVAVGDTFDSPAQPHASDLTHASHTASTETTSNIESTGRGHADVGVIDLTRPPASTSPPPALAALSTPPSGKRDRGAESKISPDEGGSSPDRRKRRRVVVRDSSYITFRALLFFLYTDTIDFAPLTSSFIDSDAATGASTEHSTALHRATLGSSYPVELAGAHEGASTAANQEFANELMKAHRLRKQIIDDYCRNHPSRPPPCSAKAMYRLADKLQLQDLKKRAERHIASSLTVQNIVWEAFSAFANHHPDIRRLELSFLLSHWKEVKRTRALQTIFSRNHAHPGLADIWPLLLGRLDYNLPSEDCDDDDDAASLAASMSL
ncbi:unnamed protein product [Parajaminaea phylloscopi]